MLRLHRLVASGLLSFLGALSISAAAQASTTVTYTYDTLGRLSTAVYVDSSTGQTYTYDSAGNRTFVITTIG